MLKSNTLNRILKMITVFQVFLITPTNKKLRAKEEWMMTKRKKR
jgi:hypothetical protein